MGMNLNKNRLTDKVPPKISPFKGAEIEGPEPIGMGKEPPEPTSSGVNYKQGVTLGTKNLKGACSYLKC